MDEQQVRIRAARRAFIRAQHPDRGGDPGAFIAGLASFDAALARCSGPRPSVMVYKRTPGWQRIVRRIRRWRRPPPPRVR